MWVIYNTETYKIVTKHYSKADMRRFWKTFVKVPANKIAFAKLDQFQILKKLAMPTPAPTVELNFLQAFQSMGRALRGGMKVGELSIISAGRSTGKTMMTQYMIDEWLKESRAKSTA